MVQGYRYIVVHTGTHEAVLYGTGVQVYSGTYRHTWGCTLWYRGTGIQWYIPAHMRLYSVVQGYR